MKTDIRFFVQDRQGDLPPGIDIRAHPWADGVEGLDGGISEEGGVAIIGDLYDFEVRTKRGEHWQGHLVFRSLMWPLGVSCTKERQLGVGLFWVLCTVRFVQNKGKEDFLLTHA